MYAHKTTMDWQETVERMRKYPGSAIYPQDISVIMRCLSYSQSTLLDTPADDAVCRR